jgi:replicative DNA helicase
MSAVPDHRDQVDRMEALYGRPDDRVEALRVPPTAVEAEQSVIGGLMIDPAALTKIADWLTAEDFYRRDHRLIYGAIASLAEKGQPVDAVTMGEWFEANGLAEQVGAGYLVDLQRTTPSAANIVAYAEIVAEKARLRQAIEIGSSLVDKAFSRGATSADLTAQAQHALTTLAPVRHTGLLPSKAGLARWFEEVLARTDRPGLIGLPTPWSELNRATHGLRNGRLYILAGRPGMGKSIVGGQLASFSALRGTRTALFSLEMSAEEVHQRNVSALASVPHDFLEAPVEKSDYWGALNVAISQLKPAPLLIDDTPALTASQIVARAERAHLQSGLGLIVIDHLHEMAVDAKDRVNALGDAARKLKGLAKRLGVPVVLLAQLNRDSAKGGARPTLTDLRASGSIEEVADAVLLLHREDYYKPETHLKGVVELILAKGRNMRSGLTINLRAQMEFMRFVDWEGPLPEEPPPPQEPQKQTRGYDARRAASGER